MVQQQVVSSSSSSSSSAHIFIKSRLKNPLQNFAEGEAGESRDNVAERLDWARRLEQVERLKAKERMVTSTGGANPRPLQNFAEAGITRDNVAEAVGLGSVLSTQSGWSKWRG